MTTDTEASSPPAGSGLVERYVCYECDGPLNGPYCPRCSDSSQAELDRAAARIVALEAEVGRLREREAREGE